MIHVWQDAGIWMLALDRDRSRLPESRECLEEPHTSICGTTPMWSPIISSGVSFGDFQIVGDYFIGSPGGRSGYSLAADLLHKVHFVTACSNPFARWHHRPRSIPQNRSHFRLSARNRRCAFSSPQARRPFQHASGFHRSKARSRGIRLRPRCRSLRPAITFDRGSYSY